jgi:hypothetical protein
MVNPRVVVKREMRKARSESGGFYSSGFLPDTIKNGREAYPDEAACLPLSRLGGKGGSAGPGDGVVDKEKTKHDLGR